MVGFTFKKIQLNNKQFSEFNKESKKSRQGGEFTLDEKLWEAYKKKGVGFYKETRTKIIYRFDKIYSRPAENIDKSLGYLDYRIRFTVL